MALPASDRRRFRRLASSRLGFVVYEAEDTYAGMCAVRRLADAAFGESWDDGAWIRSRLNDEMLLESYWNWLSCDERRKVILTRHGVLAGFSYLTYFNRLRGLDWGGFSPDASNPRVRRYVDQAELDVREALVLADINRRLSSDDILMQCDDVYTVTGCWEDYAATAESNDPNLRRIAAGCHIIMDDRRRYDGIIERLASDPEWRVRRAAAMNDDMPDRVFEALAEDADWRVRRGCCLSCHALNPWAVENVSERRVEALVRLIGDKHFEVRVAAIEFALHSPPWIRQLASSRLLEVDDPGLREAVAMKMLEW